MDPQNSLKQLQDLFIKAKDILIVTNEKPSIDGLCSCLALRLALSQKIDMQGIKKRVTFAVSNRNGSQYSLLPGSDQIVSELGLRDLVIGVNGFVDGSIENVNWYVDKGRLNVVFKSNPEVPMQFDLKNLDPFYAGANFDVVVVIGANYPQELGNAYKQDPGMYSELPVVNISNSTLNSRFGRVNIVDSSVASLSEMVFQLAQILNLNIMGEVATLLMTGIAEATNNFVNRGPQTDGIVSQLNSVGAGMFDLNVLRSQAAGAPLPIHKNFNNTNSQSGASQVPSSFYPQYQTNPYLPNPYPPNPYGQYPMPSGNYYSGQYPVPPQPYPQYSPVPNLNVNNSPSVYSPQVMEESTMNVAEVPSIEHDLVQNGNYIPTSDVPAYSHVEPSVYIPGVPSQSDVHNSDADNSSWSGNDLPLEEHKEQQTIQNFDVPPQSFNPDQKKF